jgi:hypothetical protein
MSLHRSLRLSNCTKGVSKIGGGLPLFTLLPRVCLLDNQYSVMRKVMHYDRG